MDHKNKPSINRSISWLKLPKKIQENHFKKYINCDIDYIQYASYNIAHSLNTLYSLGFTGTIDTDNSNVEYNYDYTLSLTHLDTGMGHAYLLSFMSPGFPAIPVLSVESYNPQQVKTVKCEGRVILYGAYFRFLEILKEEAPGVVSYANYLEIGCTHIKNKPYYKRTRVDVALDFEMPLDQKWHSEYILPHKTSKKCVKPYNYQKDLGGWQSLNYLNRTGVGIRIYNKLLDIEAKKKQCWYPDYIENYKHVTRVEFVYGIRFAQNSLESLMNLSKNRIMGTSETVVLSRYCRPKSIYNPYNAYVYFNKYAKNHGKEFGDLLTDVSAVWLRERVENLNPPCNINNIFG